MKLLKSRREPETSAETSASVVESTGRGGQSQTGAGRSLTVQTSTAPSHVMTFLVFAAVRLSVCLCVCLSVNLSACPSVCMSICLSVGDIVKMHE